MINSTADKVSALTEALETKGLGEKAWEAVKKFSDLNDLVNRDMPLSTMHICAVFLGVGDIFNQREAYRRKLYDRFIKPYEALLQ